MHIYFKTILFFGVLFSFSCIALGQQNTTPVNTFHRNDSLIVSYYRPHSSTIWTMNGNRLNYDYMTSRLNLYSESRHQLQISNNWNNCKKCCSWIILANFCGSVLFGHYYSGIVGSRFPYYSIVSSGLGALTSSFISQGHLKKAVRAYNLRRLG
jgi:hypothetical protein